jgi:glycerol uptake operon antiterminator
MKMNSIFDSIEANPVIAAVRQEDDITAAVASQVTTVFLLHADIFNIKSLVDNIRAHGKSAFVHIDLLEGLGKDHRAIDYLGSVIKPDGIITTKSTHIKYAKDIGLFTIQRFFLVDSQSYDMTIKTTRSVQPDMLEIMPAVMPGIIKRICGQLDLPVIAGGLVDTKEDIMEALNAGAIGVSTGKKDLWEL